jgi:hypothetical protein
MNKILTTRSQLRATQESGRRIIFEPAPPAPPPPAAGPYIISISPDISSPNFEDPLTITITGGRFTGVSKVSFVARGPVDSFVVNSDTQITVTTYLYGREGDPVDNMFVTAADGVTTSPITPATDFWYAYAWPEDCAFGPVAVTANRIWTTNGSSWYFNNFTSPPDRFLITAGQQGVGNANWPRPPNQVDNAGLILSDSNYVYYISKTAACLTRIPINFTPPDGGDWATYDTLIIPAGCPPLGKANSYPGIQGQIYNNKMYLAWSYGTGNVWNGVNDSISRLLVIDLVAWSPAAFNIYPIPTAVPSTYGYGYAFSVCVANNVIVVSMFTPSSWSGSVWNSYSGQLYYAPVSNPATWTTINLTYRVGNGVAVGNYCYFLENSWQGTSSFGSFPAYNTGLGHQRHLIVADCTSGTPIVSYVDMSADDANFKFIAQTSLQSRDPTPWASSTRLYVPSNVVTNSQDTYTVPYPPFYIAKRLLVTGAADGGGSTPPSVVDPYFSNVVFLDGFEAQDGAQWTLDESSFKSGGAYFSYYNSGISAQISAAQKKFGATSLRLKGSAAIGWVGGNPNWDFGTGLFTVECWFFATASSWPMYLVSRYDTGSYASGFAGYWGLWIDAAGHIGWRMNNGGADANIPSSTTPSLNVWHHAAVDFDGTTYRCYMDGLTIGTLAITPFNLTNSFPRLSIGGDTDSAVNYFVGYIDETRITKGTARYASSSGYTVPIAAFPRGPTPQPANGFFMKDLTPWSWELWPNTGACYGGKLYVEFAGWDYSGFFAIANEDKTSPTMYPVPTIPAPSNDLFANASTVTLGALTTGNVYLATGEANEQWPASWDYYVGTNPPLAGVIGPQYSSQALWGVEHTIWYKFIPASTGDYTVIYHDRQSSFQFDLTIWSGSAPGSLTNLYQNIATNLPTVPLIHMTAGTTYHLAFDRYFYYGLNGSYLPDLENDGIVKFTIANASTPGTCPSFVNAGSQVTASGTTAQVVTPPLPSGRANGSLLLAICRIDIDLAVTSLPGLPSFSGGTWQDIGSNIAHAMGSTQVKLLACYVNGSEAAPTFTGSTWPYVYSLTAQVFQYTGVEQFYIYDVFGRLYSGAWSFKWNGGSSWGTSDGTQNPTVRSPAPVITYPYSTLINLTMYRPTEAFQPSLPAGFTSRSLTANWRLSDMALSTGDINIVAPSVTLPETPTSWGCVLLELRSQ